MKIVKSIWIGYREEGSVCFEPLEEDNVPYNGEYAILSCPYKNERRAELFSTSCVFFCAHCGSLETDPNGKKRLVLTCGNGTEIREEGFKSVFERKEAAR